MLVRTPKGGAAMDVPVEKPVASMRTASRERFDEIVRPQLTAATSAAPPRAAPVPAQALAPVAPDDDDADDEELRQRVLASVRAEIDAEHTRVASGASSALSGTDDERAADRAQDAERRYTNDLLAQLDSLGS